MILKIYSLALFSLSCLITVHAEANDTSNHLSTADEVHEEVSAGLSSFIVGIDQFFGNSGQHEDSSDLIIDLELNSLTSRYQKEIYTQKYRMKVRLDNLNKQVAKFGKRIELVVAPSNLLPENEDVDITDYKSQSSSVHLQASGMHSRNLKYQLGHDGIKSIFVGASYKKVFSLDDNEVSAQGTFRITDKEEKQLRLASALSRTINKQWLHVTYADAQYRSELDNQQLTVGTKLRHKINTEQAVSINLSGFGTTENDFQMEGYAFTLGHRLKLYSSWVFLNTDVFVDWQKIRNFSANPGLQLGLNIYFGN